MAQRGPLVTLLAVFALGAVLLAVDYGTHPEPADQTVAAPGATTTPPAPTTPAPTTTSAPTTTTPTTTPTTTSFPPQVAYVGHTADGGVSVAVAVKAGRAVAYVCDGRRVEAWLQGSAADGTLSLQGSSGATLTGSLADIDLAGTVTVDGAPRQFTAAPATPPAGLYRANAANRGLLDRIGWIVQPDGSTVGLRDRGGSVEPAPPLDPSTPSVVLDGDRVPVEQVTGDAGSG